MHLANLEAALEQKLSQGGKMQGHEYNQTSPAEPKRAEDEPQQASLSEAAAESVWIAKAGAARPNLRERLEKRLHNKMREVRSLQTALALLDTNPELAQLFELVKESF